MRLVRSELGIGMLMREWKVLVGCLLILFSKTVFALGVTPEMQQRVRGATFEVVQKKPEKDPLNYEKPLPLELLPYLERTDAYRSIGTAFALGNNTYVTAGHVFSTCIASQYGPPALRASDGRVYAVDRILKFSAHEDFIVFSLANDPAPAGLMLSPLPKIDETVMAVGNALGEGIVIREGLFTSETPEDQDGRWKWIRFSAAASPGNSGGPLLDDAGHVIGIVIGKSPNENLNYALPISRVLEAPAGMATFDQRALESLPLLNATATYQMKDSFLLPKSWTEFSAEYQRLIDLHSAKSREQLQQANRDTLFPKGKGAEAILYGADTFEEPRLIAQDGDKSWQLFEPNYRKTELAEDGFVEVASSAGTLLLRIRRPANAFDAGFYANSRSFMDAALHGLNLTRQVGSDAVKITSLGAAASEVAYIDAYGRRWQKRVWAVPFLDVYVVALLLPTPDGYVGLLTYSPSLLLHETIARLEWSARSIYFSYRGTLAQWRAFLSRRDLLPDSLKAIDISSAQNGVWRIAHNKAALNITKEIVDLDDNGILGVDMGYSPEEGTVKWVPVGLTVAHDESLKRYLKLIRRLKVPATASRELRDDWQDLLQKLSPYSGMVSREEENSWTSRSVVDVPGSQLQTVADNVAYVLTSHVENVVGQDAPRTILNASMRAVQILEKGSGSRQVGTSNSPEADQEKLADESVEKIIQDMLKSYNERNSVEFRDDRGRLFVEDFKEFVFTADERRELRKFLVAMQVAEASSDRETFESLNTEYQSHMKSIMGAAGTLNRYWHRAAHINALRGSWSAFLSRNRLPAGYAHSDEVLSQEKLVGKLMADYGGRSPDENLVEATVPLVNAYLGERRELFSKIESQTSMDLLTFTAEFSKCSVGANEDVKAYLQRPEKDARINMVTSKSAEDYFPKESLRQAQQGNVMVAARLNAEGCVIDSAIVVSTGVPELDAAALRYTNEGLRFYPATVAGKAVPNLKKFAVNFNH